LLVVTVLDTPDLSGTFRVSPQGTITLAQGGTVTVAGLATLQAEQEIERHLRDAEIMLEPHVTVLVQEYGSSGVVVLGQVNKPGTYTLLGEHSLYGALAAAGGTGPDLGQSITVSHQNDPTSKEVIDINSPNYSDRVRATTVNPGDTVVVSRGQQIYVYGDVNHPGVFSMGTHPINLLEALSLAEGVDRIAAARKGSILRKTDTGVQSIPIDLKRIAKNQDPNPVLQASDIVYIPRSLAKALFFQALPGITSSAAGAGIAAAVVH
jgi:polysaccharide export outer membrane protein